MLQVGDGPKQLSLAIGDLGPATGEEVGVQLALDRIDRDDARLVLRVLLDEDVEDLSADELDEVWVAPRLVADRVDGVGEKLIGQPATPIGLRTASRLSWSFSLERVTTRNIRSA